MIVEYLIKCSISITKTNTNSNTSKNYNNYDYNNHRLNHFLDSRTVKLNINIVDKMQYQYEYY